MNKRTKGALEGTTKEEIASDSTTAGPMELSVHPTESLEFTGTVHSHASNDNINPFSSGAMSFVDYPAMFPPAVPGEFTSLRLQAHGNAAASSSARRLDFQSARVSQLSCSSPASSSSSSRFDWWSEPRLGDFHAIIMAEEGHKVSLNVYDLSNGLARQLSTSFLGKPIEAIWHTGVVVYGNEYFFGGGIQSTAAGATQYGHPVRVVDLGVTHLPREVFEDYLRDIAPRYTAETYRLMSHNCNNFSNEVAQFLVGAGIPDYILSLPNEVMSSPMGPLIMPMIQNLEATLRNNTAPQTTQFVPSPASVSVTPPAAAAAVANKAATASTTTATVSRAAAPDSPSKQVEEKKVEKETQQKAKVTATAADPLGNMRGKVQEEVMKEFAAIMASGTLRASEAAALAMRRVMERHGDATGMQQA
uniref:Uncharacterized protein n=1 Tax=Avena sativa TaxID=4498 RepID=A0ACD5ZD69_AVESA